MRYITKHATIIALILIIIITLCLLSSTSCSEPKAPFTKIPEPDYAGPILEAMLISANENDYESYIAYYYNPVETRQQFENEVAFIKNALGDYIPDSKHFSDASFQYDSIHRIGYTVVDYYARFTKYSEEELVEIVFRKIGFRTYVETIDFNGRGKYY